MLTFIFVGKLIGNGISLYRQQNYFQAKQAFQQAVTEDPGDFSAAFWLARAYTRLGDCSAARGLLYKCRGLNGQAAEKLIPLWESLIGELERDGGLSPGHIDQYDQAADEQLEKYYGISRFAIADVLIISILMLFAKAGTIHIYPLAGMLGNIVYVSLLLLSILAYLNRRTVLPLNLWLRYRRVAAEGGKLAHKALFLTIILIMVALAAVVVLGNTIIAIDNPLLKARLIELAHESPLRQPLNFWVIAFLGIIWAPLAEEVTFRLVLYNYLAKYSKIFAGVAVSLLFLQWHPTIEYRHLITSAIYIGAYERYRTIVAPMMLHAVYNLAAAIFNLVNLWILT